MSGKVVQLIMHNVHHEFWTDVETSSKFYTFIDVRIAKAAFHGAMPLHHFNSRCR